MPGVAQVRSATSPGLQPSPARGSSDFTLSAPAAEIADSRPAVAPQAAAALAGALALQELGCEAPQDRAARRRGYDLLAALRALQRAELGDGLGPELLDHLAQLATEVPQAADPRLRDAVAALVLRARVEVARHRP